MEKIKNLIKRMADSANAAQCHYQIWFTLRGNNMALPEFYEDMNDARYRDFFRANNPGHYKLIFIELGCLFDTDPRAASFMNLKKELENSKYSKLTKEIESKLKAHKKSVAKIKKIRSRLIAHKDLDADRHGVYKSPSGITPDNIRDLIRDSCSLLNSLNKKIFGPLNNPVADESDRYEKATFSLLEVVRKGRE